MNTNAHTVAPVPDALAHAKLSPLALALARLDASRQALRLALNPPDESDGGPLDAQGRPQRGGGNRTLAGWWRRGRRALQAWPVADLAAGLLQNWWQRHPWRSTGEQLADTARQAVLPLVRRHPVGALLSALALGAGLVALRAWRWPAVRAMRPAATQGSRHWLAAQLANPAVQTALLSALMLVVKQLTAGRAEATPTAAPATAAPPPPPA